MVWNLKKSRNLSLKDPIPVKVPESLSAYRRDLESMHGITDGPD